MDEEYDAVVCGTGLTECILSGLLSQEKMKVLHVDRNGYYGGESASLNLTNLYQKFVPGENPPKEFGANRDWNVDLTPKFVMSAGKLVKVLLKTQLTKYLDWRLVDGTYVYQYQKPGFFSGPKLIHKVPANDAEAAISPLMSLFEKGRCRTFFQFCDRWNTNNPQTFKGIDIFKLFDPEKTPMREVFAYFNLQENTIDFVGHAVALYTNDNYLDEPMGKTMEKIKLYMNSIASYGTSPFIYPLYGLGGLPEGFSRLSAIHGGTYMLNNAIEEFVYDENGKVNGVKSKTGEIAKCKMVLCDPSYVLNTKKVLKVGEIIRCICILGSPIPNTNNATSCQIIIPQKQIQRKHDVYISLISSAHKVAKEGKYIAIVSTTIETDDPLKEISSALELLGPIEAQFVNISSEYRSIDDGTNDNVYVSNSFDATSHFETATEDVLRIYKNITGKELDLTIKPVSQNEEENP